MPVNRRQQPAPKRQRVLTFVSPNVADILFYETVDAQRVGKNIPAYGTKHPDSSRWPDHELVYVQQDDQEGQLYRYYYAATRASQDTHNYEIQDGSELVRTYIIKRDEYPSSLPVPAGGTLDSVFTDYGFVGDSIKSLGDPLSGVYIAVQRRFVIPETIEQMYDVGTEGTVTATKTIVPSGYNLVDEGLTSSPGDIYEVKHGNNFHDVLINQSIKDASGNIDDRELDTVYGSQKYDGIPSRLDAVEVHYLFAAGEYTSSSGRISAAYDEDLTALFPVTAPSSGPFKTKIERTLTTAPQTKVDAILASATLLPRPKREDITTKFNAFGDNPTVARSQARQFTLPAAIHGPLNVQLTGSGGGTITAQRSRSTRPLSFDATPGFEQFTVGGVLQYELVGTYLIDVSIRKVSLDMYIVEATSLVLNGVYQT